MENTSICRTIVGIANQASKLLGRPYEFLKYTTLNERFDVLPEAHLDLTTSPNVAYFHLGYGGHRSHLDDDGVSLQDTVPHQATNTGLYRPMPLVVRQLNDDLPPERRKQYGLRRKETHNGVEYWAYYAKRLNPSTLPSEIIHDNTKDGVTTSKPYVFTSDDLNPVPSNLPEVGVVVASNDIIRVSAKLVLDFNAQDVEEYINAARIVKGSEKYAIISEIALVSGVDKEVQVEGERGQTITMKEIVGAQIVTFISTYMLVTNINQGFYHEFEVGEGEPLLTKGEIRPTRYSADVTLSTGSPHLAGTIYDASNPGNGDGVSTASTVGRNSSTAGTPTGAPGNPTNQPGVHP